MSVEMQQPVLAQQPAPHETAIDDTVKKAPVLREAEPDMGYRHALPPKSAKKTDADGKRQLADYRMVGQVFATYLILEGEGEMLLIDQHAAHERLKYEQLRSGLNGMQIVSQVLLEPVTVDLSPTEFSLAKENMEFFSKIGFEIAEFGNHTIIIQLTPVDLPPGELADLFVELLGQIASSRREVMGERQLRALYTVACKAAVKANHILSDSEAAALIAEVFALDGINTCPHGRPIMISMTKRELEKQFKRIV